MWEDATGASPKTKASSKDQHHKGLRMIWEGLNGNTIVELEGLANHMASWMERPARCFAIVTLFHRTEQQTGMADYFVKFILAASASGSVLSYVMEDWLPDPAGYGLTVMTAALAFWIMIYDYSAKIVVSREVRDQYQKLELTARRLWSDLADMDEAEARERINDLESEIQDYHSLPDKANVRYRKRLNKRCTQDVTELIKAEYG